MPSGIGFPTKRPWQPVDFKNTLGAESGHLEMLTGGNFAIVEWLSNRHRLWIGVFIYPAKQNFIVIPSSTTESHLNIFGDLFSPQVFVDMTVAVMLVAVTAASVTTSSIIFAPFLPCFKQHTITLTIGICIQMAFLYKWWGYSLPIESWISHISNSSSLRIQKCLTKTQTYVKNNMNQTLKQLG